MNIYVVKIGIDSRLSQQELMDMLHNSGAELIQTSDGLCFKTEMDINALQRAEDKLKDVHFQLFVPSENDSPDVVAFTKS